jgi:hypothetical protein
MLIITDCSLWICTNPSTVFRHKVYIVYLFVTLFCYGLIVTIFYPEFYRLYDTTVMVCLTKIL